MKSIIKVALVILLVIVGLPILMFALVLSFGADGICGNDIYAEIHSPDRRYKAIVFQRDCGASTDFSTQISILKNNAALKNKSGNTFIVRGHPDAHALELKWLLNKELLINRQLDGSEVKAAQSQGWLNKIEVSYAVSDS
ncbi:hypothetical protein Q3O59_02645 [Alkalimonas delamerensis]|uniref:Uncharacterized protein n=1 Tax=Alkalimonas delamerensis TaxID=265981 RepID=A0ABT9GLT3_9GAMM|nr:hypothetical protein [Alkalimonas delamerensis]MDP4527933.1 hypothetical protein [Alkalimonas delamerensis]